MVHLFQDDGRCVVALTAARGRITYRCMRRPVVLGPLLGEPASLRRAAGTSFGFNVPFGSVHFEFFVLFSLVSRETALPRFGPPWFGRIFCFACADRPPAWRREMEGGGGCAPISFSVFFFFCSCVVVGAASFRKRPMGVGGGGVHWEKITMVGQEHDLT